MTRAATQRLRAAGRRLLLRGLLLLPSRCAHLDVDGLRQLGDIWGEAPFADSMMAGCEARNNALLMFPMLGENWHNNHHAAPGSLSTWVYWYQIDFVYLTGRVFELVGLASDLRVEVPHTPLHPSQPLPPAAFPALLWTGWAVVFALVWRWRMAAPAPAPDHTPASAKDGTAPLMEKFSS